MVINSRQELVSINKTISIVIPVYNEGSLIETALHTIQQEVEKIGIAYEIIAVDDGSNDSTYEKLMELCKQINELRFISFSRNFGKEAAICAGLDYASGDAIIIMDADLQHPPALIPQMVNLWLHEDYKVVECIKKHRGKELFYSRLGSWMFYTLFRYFSNYDLQNASDFKLLDKVVVAAWKQMGERQTFFRGMVKWLGFTSKTLEFEVSERVGGTTRWSFKSLVNLAFGAMVSFSSAPLQLVTSMGMFFLLFALLLGLDTFYNKLIGVAVSGFTTVIILQLIIGSIIMISLGIIGQYISKIYDEVKNRPRYLIRETNVIKHGK